MRGRVGGASVDFGLLLMSWVNLVLGGINYIGSLVKGKLPQFTEPATSFSKSRKRERLSRLIETNGRKNEDERERPTEKRDRSTLLATVHHG